jgi:hypothetical protein
VSRTVTSRLFSRPQIRISPLFPTTLPSPYFCLPHTSFRSPGSTSLRFQPACKIFLAMSGRKRKRASPGPPGPSGKRQTGIGSYFKRTVPPRRWLECTRFCVKPLGHKSTSFSSSQPASISVWSSYYQPSRFSSARSSPVDPNSVPVCCIFHVSCRSDLWRSFFVTCPRLTAAVSCRRSVRTIYCRLLAPTACPHQPDYGRPQVRCHAP